MTSFDVAATVHELNQTITNARIENIYQLNRSTLLLKLHKPDHPTMQLLIEAGKRLHLTAHVFEKPLKPPVFCMTLRKHLSNGIIKDVEQHEFERTVTLKISTKQGMMQLIVELFGEGNIILADQQSIIITALMFKKMRDRSILRNTAFQHAPRSGKNPLQIALTEFDELKDMGHLEIVRALTRFLSIGGLYAEEILLRASVDKNTPCQALTRQQLSAIFTQLQNILDVIRDGKFDPVTVSDEKGQSIDATPVKLRRYEGLPTKSYATLNEALNEYYAQTSHAMQVSEVQREYEEELGKQQRMLQDQSKALEDAKKAVEKNKQTGDLIYARLGELQLLQQRFIEAKQKGESWEKVISRLQDEKQKRQSPAILFDSFDAKNRVLNAAMLGATFPVPINQSVQATAAEYYERMKKAQRKLQGAERAMQETRRRIGELQQQWAKKIEEARVKEPPKHLKRAWYEKFRWFKSSDGFLVLGGRDATSNEILVKKHSEPHDIVFHSEFAGAPFVVVKTEGKTPTEGVIQEAAQFGASYSRAWRERFSTCDVYWVYPNQLSKSAPSRQYVGRGAFIIHGQRNYIRRVPLRIAIGVQKEDEQLRVIGGPVEAIRKHTDVYVEIVPGDEPSAKLAHKLRSSLRQKARLEDRDLVMKIPIEDIQQFIPMGKGEIPQARSNSDAARVVKQ